MEIIWLRLGSLMCAELVNHMHNLPSHMHFYGIATNANLPFCKSGPWSKAILTLGIFLKLPASILHYNPKE